MRIRPLWNMKLTCRIKLWQWAWYIAIVQCIQTILSKYCFKVVFLFHILLILNLSIIIDGDIFIIDLKIFSSVSNWKYSITVMQLYYFNDRDEWANSWNFLIPENQWNLSPLNQIKVVKVLFWIIKGTIWIKRSR